MTQFTLAALGLLVAGAASMAAASALGGARWWAVAVVPVVWFGLVWVGRTVHSWWVRRCVAGEKDGSRPIHALRALGLAARAQAVAAGQAGFTREMGAAPSLERAVMMPWSEVSEEDVLADLERAPAAARRALVAGLRDLHEEAVTALGYPLHPLFPEAPQLLRLAGLPVPLFFTRLRVRTVWRVRRRHLDPGDPDTAIAVRLLRAGLPQAALRALRGRDHEGLAARLRTLARFLALLRRGGEGGLALTPAEFGASARELILLAGRRVRELTPGSPFLQAVPGGAAALERSVARTGVLVDELVELRREVPELGVAVVEVLARLLRRPVTAIEAGLDSGTLRVQPDRVLQTHLRGIALLDERRPREAVGEFEAVLSREPGFGPALYALARALAEGGHVRRAQALLRSAVQRRPDDLDARLLLARFLAEEVDGDGARAVYEEALARFPRSANLRLEYAQHLLAWDDEESACKHLDAAYRDHPRDARLAFLAGRSLVTSGRADDAVEPLRLACEGLGGDDGAEARFWLLCAYRDQGRHENALGLADAVMTGLGAGQEGLLEELADYLEEQHEFMRARKASARARELRGY